ncbi:MAG TPA: ribosome maturation factor RimM [Bryobacteraceae bacterium]|nr:ribosome maturation factor RimM [Bryobacteraceae bacterium]
MSSSDAEWVAIALLGKTRGNRGELTAIALSSKPERYQNLSAVYLFGAGLAPEGERLEVETSWFHDGTLILKFRGVDSISDAERLCGAEVRIPLAERMPLEPGEFFESDLIGCEVIERATGETLGRVSRWEDAGGAGLLVVGDLLIPFAREICVAIDPAARRIAVELPPGLKELNRA